DDDIGGELLGMGAHVVLEATGALLLRALDHHGERARVGGVLGGAGGGGGALLDIVIADRDRSQCAQRREVGEDVALAVGGAAAVVAPAARASVPRVARPLGRVGGLHVVVGVEEHARRSRRAVVGGDDRVGAVGRRREARLEALGGQRTGHPAGRGG